MSFRGTKNCWVDHCEFVDGMDGNFDITQKSDFNTVSWCTFSYSARSYMHQNTNLVGGSDSEATGYLNTTFAFNHWGDGCLARMPMARVGKIHMLNNYYTCKEGNNCINPRKNSEFLVEGNYFAAGVESIYTQAGATLFRERGEATGVRQAKTVPQARQECYDLAGRRAGENACGVVIVGGKLVVK